MKYISETTEFKLNNSVVTLGKFDGLHKGHQLLINHILELKKKGYLSVVFTFSLHPSNLFFDKDKELIYTEKEKKHKIEQLGLDVLVAYPFVKETACMEPEDFIKEVLVEKLDAKVIVVGKDFRFGHHRRGDVAMLKTLSVKYGYEVVAYDKLSQDGEIISSSRIKEELSNGNMEKVNGMLGSPFSIMGEVLHGRKIGRTLGMPTTNLLPLDHKLLPPNGVYASMTRVDNKEYHSVTNIGYKPTVGAENKKGVETYIIDYDNDLYGKEIEILLYSYERGEEKFDSLEELKQCMYKDIAYAKQYFEIDERTL